MRIILGFNGPVGKYSCSAWPTSQTYGCKSGGAWETLDSTMNYSDTERCERLCLQNQEEGCCYLKDGVGCYWNAGTMSGTDGTGIAVHCVKGMFESI